MSSAFDIGREPCGVRAELTAEIRVPGLDGRRWEFLVSDGERSGVIRADLPESESRGYHPGTRELEDAIESFAGSFAVEHRLSEMLIECDAHGPYVIRLEDHGLAIFRHPLRRLAG